ncbi:hypothetical protein [Streptomyces sp. UNOC14_S4]|uniref:hypothetical protein n=1 Tax=Streptomyces sp. UNOC14_S4 TaxID=2872340 RepID=UPI001E309C82|nr:hypothetical protein [Streptomyces sp. UNOC14_S4]MCC3769574.1 hypothetical protein [Streptomyces sp. UNOC14_S4]
MAEHDRAAQDMAAAVAAMTSFQQVTQQADAKAGTMVTVHVGLAAVVSAQVGQVGAPPPTQPLAVLFWLATLAYVLTFTVSGYLLVQVIRPRTARYAAPNRFSLDSADHSGANGEQLAAQMWATADALARIADRKNGYAARAVIWVSVMVLSAVAWLVLAGRAA